MTIKNNFLHRWLIVTLLLCIGIIQPRSLTARQFTGKNETKTPQQAAADYFGYLFRKGDFESIKKNISPDAVYFQAQGLPYGGVYTGFDAWMTMFGKAQGYFDLQIVGDPVYYTSATNPEGVFINFTIKCISKKTKKEITMPIAEYFQVKNGLITEIRAFYFDTKAFTEFLN